MYINKNLITRQFKVVIVFTIIMLLCLLYYYNAVIFLPPSHIHLWTQSDRYALALGYLNNGFNFFMPQTYNLATIGGVTGVDFPINEYVVALILKLLNNTNPAIFRIYNVTIAVLGYWVLYKFVLGISKQIWKAAFVVLFTFSIPIVTYYQCGFLPTASSFSFAIIGICYYFKYSNKFKHFVIAISFLTLATLCRSPFAIYLFAVILLQLYKQFKNKQLNIKVNLTLSFSVLAIIAWQWYKYYLNNKYGSQFLATMLPASSFVDFVDNTKNIITRWWLQLFTIPHYCIMLFLIFFIKKNILTSSAPNNYIKLSAALFIIYFVLMNKQFIHHEYYFMDSFYITIIFWVVYKINNFQLSNYKLTGLFVTLSLFSCLIISKKIQNEKYSDVNWDYAEISRKGYENGNKFLDSLNIPFSAKVLVIDAFASNYPLIQLNRKGFTLIDRNYNSIEKAISWNYDYLIVQKKYLPSEVVSVYPTFLSYFLKVGSNKSFIVFKKRPNKLTSDLSVILDIKSPTIYTLDSTYNKNVWSGINFAKNEMFDTKYCNVNKTEDYAATLIIKKKSDYNKLFFEGFVHLNKENNAFLLCVTLHKNGKQIYYTDKIVNALFENRFFKFNTLFEFDGYQNKYDELRFFIANKNHCGFFYKDIKITLGN